MKAHDGSIWGFGPLVTRGRPEEGDLILVAFDPKRRSAAAQLLDELDPDDVSRLLSAPLDQGSDDADDADVIS